MTIESRPSADLPIGITGYNGEKVSFEKIQEVLAQSNEGRILRGKPRFDYFRPSSVSVEEWIEMLGPDVDNFLHMPYTYNLSREVLKGCNDFTYDEETKILFHAPTHDIQEAITGDKRKIDKTIEDEKDEAELLVSILSYVLASEIDCVRLGELTEASREMMIDEDSKLGRVFSAIEKLGYTKTALRAWEIKKQAGFGGEYGEDPLQTGLGMLAHSVLIHNTYKMVDFANDYPPIKDFLIANAQEITEILEESEELGTYENTKIMNLSLTSWNNFRTSLDS